MRADLYNASQVFCDFCDKKVPPRSTVVWHGRTVLCCCQRCAEEALPMMIADSLDLKDGINPYHEVEKEWDGRFKVRFLRSIMARCRTSKEK